MYPNIPGFDNAEYFTSLISALYLLIKYTSVHYLPRPTTEKKSKQINNNTNIYAQWNIAYSFFWYKFMCTLLKILIEINFFIEKRTKGYSFVCSLMLGNIVKNKLYR